MIKILKLISLFLKYNPEFLIENESRETPLHVCDERILTIFNLKKKKKTLRKRTSIELLKKESGFQTEKSLNTTNNSEAKIKKSFGFKKKLVEVL